MSFIKDAHRLIVETVSVLEPRTRDYIPRVLVREGATPEEAKWSGWLKNRGEIADAKVVDDADILEFSRVFLIGNSRSGKSQILLHAFLTQCQRFVENPAEPIPLFLDLASQLPATLSIDTALIHWSRGLSARAATEHPSGIMLFVDALDEVLLRTGGSAFFNDVRFFVENCPLQSRIFLACRRALWEPTRFQGMQPGFVIFHCDSLEPEVYRHLISEDAARSRFFATVRELGIEAFLDFPFEGFDLARTFAIGAPLPRNRQEWFEQQVTKRLSATSTDQNRGKRTPLARLRQLSQQLACIASFSGATVWSPQEATDFLGESQTLAAEHPVEFDEVDSLLQSPLFKRTGDSFSFDHQSFIEHLAATALASLPLRKQRQLLESPKAGPDCRILMPRRGVAINLAEQSLGFREFLIENDPLIAFVAEMPGLSAEDDERLLRSVLDQAIVKHRAPWWEIPPRGERPADWLSKHRPRNVVEFIRPYLQHQDEIARLWGCAAISAWGGAAELNELLLTLAHDDSQHPEIRKDAIEAIALGKAIEDIRKLYDLLDSRDDQIRGHALDAYRVTEHPTAREFTNKLRGGVHNENLLCLLEIEPELYAQTLNLSELQDAFVEADLNWRDLGRLGAHFVRGLIRRAIELSYKAIPATLVLKLWERNGHYGIYFETELHDLLHGNPNAFASIWNLIIERLADTRNRMDLYHFPLKLAEFCTDQVFDVLPSEDNLNHEQHEFVELMLHAYFNREPSAERLQVFRTRAGSYASRIQLPPPPRQSQVEVGRDRLAERARLTEILNNPHWNQQQKAVEIIRVIQQGIRESSGQEQGTKHILNFLGELPQFLRPRIVEALHKCVSSTTYTKSRGSTPSEFTITHLALAMPFWILYDLGEPLPANKISEIVLCYGFMGYGPVQDVGKERTPELLDALREADEILWERCLVDLGESSHIQFGDYIDYLISRQVDIYLDRCREKLSLCNFSYGELRGLLNYWAARRPQDYFQVLRENYLKLKAMLQTRDKGVGNAIISEELRELPYWEQLLPLLLLLREDDDEAWEEMHARVRNSDVPINDHDLYVPYYRQLQFPINTSRLPVLADWYAYVRKHSSEEHLTLLDQILLGAIIQIGGDFAISELRRLIAEQAYAGVEWLSYAISQIEDARLQVAGEPMKVGEVLDFVNREAFGVIQSNRDLYEWVCQAIEEIKDAIEQRAEQVQGYWNVSKQVWLPKEEVACQNVFWPMIRARLEHLNIVGVEEKLIAADRADFWVEKPIDQIRLRVIVEMKTARQDYSDAELITPLREQLWDRYLKPTHSQYGIFVVFWFKDSNRYPFPTRWQTKQEYEMALETAKVELSKEFNLSLACYVIDATKMPRMH